MVVKCNLKCNNCKISFIQKPLYKAYGGARWYKIFFVANAFFDGYKYNKAFCIDIKESMDYFSNVWYTRNLENTWLLGQTCSAQADGQSKTF